MCLPSLGIFFSRASKAWIPESSRQIPSGWSLTVFFHACEYYLRIRLCLLAYHTFRRIIARKTHNRTSCPPLLELHALLSYNVRESSTPYLSIVSSTGLTPKKVADFEEVTNDRSRTGACKDLSLFPTTMGKSLESVRVNYYASAS